MKAFNKIALKTRSSTLLKRENSGQCLKMGGEEGKTSGYYFQSTPFTQVGMKPGRFSFIPTSQKFDVIPKELNVYLDT